MNWASLFSRAILERGKRYYRMGCVENVREQGGQYTASVTGTKSYRVSITVKDDQVKAMSCTCPYAREGSRCKHMSAVLYYLEAEKDKLMEQQQMEFEDAGLGEDEEEDTFPQNYTYFDCAAMKSKAVHTEVLWRKAVKMAKAGTVVLDSAVAMYAGDYGSPSRKMLGDIQGHVNLGKASYIVRLLVDKSRIQQGLCYVKGCNQYYTEHCYGKNELCVHQMALLYHLKEYLKVHSLGDATDWKGYLFLNGCRGRRAEEGTLGAEQPETSLLELEPRLQSSFGSWEVSFRIGCGTKRYVVKNIAELVGSSLNGENMKFGSSTVWNVGAARFSEQGKQRLSYIRRIVEEERLRAVQLSSSYVDFQENIMEIKGSIPLFGRYLDELFELMEPYRIEYIEKNERDKTTAFLSLARKNPHISLTLKKEEDDRNVFQGVRITGDVPEFMYGRDASYYIADGCLNRVDGEYASRLEPQLSRADDKRVDFTVGRSRLRDFYYSVLPWLSGYVEIVEHDAEEIRSYLPPEVQFAFYLDAEDSDVTCRAEAIYGEQRAAVTDAVSGERSGALLAGEMPRDLDRERETARLVLQFFPHIDTDSSLFSCGKEEELIYRVLEQGIGRLMAVGEVHATDRFKRLNIRREPKFTVGVSIQSHLLELTVSSEQIPREELLAVLTSYKKKRRFYRLKSGDFLRLEENGVGTLSQLMEACQLSPKELAGDKLKLPVYRVLYLEKMLERNEAFYTQRDRRFKAMVKDFKTVEDSDFEVPKALKGILRPYQAAGYQWLKTLDLYGFGGILADEMGLGKTIQVIAVLAAAKETHADGPALVVAPASLIYNWEEELRRFAPMLCVSLITGSAQERLGKLADSRAADVLVTSYDLLKRDITEYEGLSFSYMILDEAQYIKNHATAAAKAVKAVKSRVRYALTGTPIENRLSELWSIFDYLMPGFLYTYEAFKRELETPIVKNSDEAASERLRKMISPFILRRLKADVLKELPEKLEKVQYARFDAAQQRLYDGQVVHMKSLLENQDEERFQKSKLQILAELTRLRQICCDPSLLYDDYHEASAKREACMELIKSAVEGEHKLLVFSQFTSMLELLEQDLSLAGIPFYKITGETPKETRLSLVKEFNRDRTPVFLISLKAGGTGLNLTGADMVIHYDPWWNLAVQNQATDRAHRIGQRRVVTVFKLIVKDSIEERILHMQQAKRDLAETVLSGETGGIGRLSRDELLELIGS